MHSLLEVNWFILILGCTGIQFSFTFILSVLELIVLPAIIGFEDTFVTGARLLKVRQINVLWLRLNSFSVDRCYYVNARHLGGS